MMKHKMWHSDTTENLEKVSNVRTKQKVQNIF